MTQPLTDEEFENVKGGQPWDWDTRVVQRLIATVESLKIWGRAVERSFIIEFDKRKTLEQENEILIGELKEARALNEN